MKKINYFPCFTLICFKENRMRLISLMLKNMFCSRSPPSKRHARSPNRNIPRKSPPTHPSNERVSQSLERKTHTPENSPPKPKEPTVSLSKQSPINCKIPLVNCFFLYSMGTRLSTQAHHCLVNPKRTKILKRKRLQIQN